MIKFLVVDDIVANIEILELAIVEYMEDHNILEGSGYQIVTVKNGQEAIDAVEKDHFDMIFLDIMMPVMDGFTVLSRIRAMNLSAQPVIIMATALGDKLTKEEEKKRGANAYMVKPFGSQTIHLMLDHYLEKMIQHTTTEDDFFDFDDFDEGTDVLENQKEIMDKFNESHEALSTQDFLKEYDYLLEEIPLDLEEIDRVLMNKFNLDDDTLDLDASIGDIREFLGLISSFLHQFSEFGELDQAISSLVDLIRDLDTASLDANTKEMVGIYIKAIMMDLVDWKDHVFVDQDAGNVFYANASLLSSYIEVKTLLESQPVQ